MPSKIDYQGVTLRLNFPMFVGQVQPRGCLRIEKACHACWYYYTIATHQLEKVGNSIDDQTILEGEPWQDNHFEQQKRSVAMLYGIEPDAMDPFWEYVAAETRRLGLPAPDPRILLKQRLIVTTPN